MPLGVNFDYCGRQEPPFKNKRISGHGFHLADIAIFWVLSGERTACTLIPRDRKVFGASGIGKWQQPKGSQQPEGVSPILYNFFPGGRIGDFGENLRPEA